MTKEELARVAANHLRFAGIISTNQMDAVAEVLAHYVGDVHAVIELPMSVAADAVRMFAHPAPGTSPPSREEVEREAVRKRLRESDERTLMGVLGPFTCGACGRSKSPSEHDGGVWAQLSDGERIHEQVCKSCSQPIGVAGEANPDGSVPVTLNEHGRKIFGDNVQIVLLPPEV